MLEVGTFPPSPQASGSGEGLEDESVASGPELISHVCVMKPP